MQRPPKAQDQDYPRPSGRRRLLVALLAVSTAVTVMYLVLEKPGGPKAPPRAAAGPAVCAAGQTSGCVGGLAQVLPAAPPATASASPAQP